MVKHPDRQKYVRELNNAAKACGLQGIRDDVGRQAVLDFIQRVRQSAGPEPAKKDAESAWTKYVATFSQDAQPAANQNEQENPPAQSFRLRGKSFLLGERDSLVRLGKRLHSRCDQMIKLKGERIPKRSCSQN